MFAVTLLLGASAAQAQADNAPAASTQFPQLPLKHEPAVTGAAPEALAWTALLVLAAAGLGVGLLKRRTGGWATGPKRWLGRAADAATPHLVVRSALTPQASLHVVAWRGEELLLGCTPHSVTLLARHPLIGGQDHAQHAAAPTGEAS